MAFFGSSWNEDSGTYYCDHIKELEQLRQSKELLKECLSVLNALSNRRIYSKKYKDTYSIASAIDKLLKK